MLTRGRLGALLLDHVAARGCPVVAATDPNVPPLDAAEGHGRLLARFHHAADDFEVPAGGEWTQLSRFSLMGGDADWITKAYADAPDEGAAMVAWWGQARAVLKATPATDTGMCHGEAHLAGCRIVGDDGRLAIAELDWAGVGDRAYDLATYRWALELHAASDADDLFTRFVDAYATVRAVPDLAALRAWVAARHLWSLRLDVGFADPAGLSRRAAFVEAWPIVSARP